MKWMTIAAVVGSLAACDGESGGNTPTAPTPPPSSANVALGVTATFSGTLQAASRMSGNAATHQCRWPVGRPSGVQEVLKCVRV